MNRASTILRSALAVLALGAAASAHAVRLDETGQALLYPYYSATTREDGSTLQTYLTIVNTGSDAKVIRVRFAEGRNHRSGLYFNLYLAPRATWAASVVPGTRPKLLTTDTSCTNPAIPAGGVEFREFAYVGGSADAGGPGLDRLEEGSIEVIEMGVLRGLEAAAAGAATPQGCASLQGAVVSFPSALGAPTGGLTGTAVVINVASGYSAGYRALGLAAFSAQPVYRNLADDLSLDAADGVSEVILDGKHRVLRWSDRIVNGRTIARGALAVTSVLMSRYLANEVILDTFTASNTEWVASAPTKRFFVDGTSFAPPFSKPFTASGSCDAAELHSIGRDQANGVTRPVDLCWHTTVLRFQNSAGHTRAGTRSAILGSRNLAAVDFESGGPFLHNGHARLGAPIRTLVSDAASTTLEPNGVMVGGPVTVTGLPLAGFAVSTFVNGEIPCGAQKCKSTFAFTTPHAGQR